jgi:hypothetical protein
MRYEDVLDLTPYQVAAIMAEKSTDPGDIDIKEFLEIKR